MHPFLPSFVRLATAFLFLFFSIITFGQNSEWTWTNGDNLPGKPGIYGTKGTPGASNLPGGRVNALHWKDSNGAFWLMGGFGLAATGTGNLNDLWKYELGNNQWTWVSGDNTINPAGVYGIKGTPASGNKPGGRNGSISFSDNSGNLWLLGGYSSGGYSNDLWKYIPSTDEWVWVSGDNTSNKRGVYGTKGTPDIANKPGARYNSSSCTDANGDFWIFGGYGYGAAGADSYLSDLWKFEVSTSTWTWVSGDNVTSQVGVYGTKDVPAAGNKPGARYSSAMWTDTRGNIWVFGGTGFALSAAGVGGELNDLWMFNPTTGEWTWKGGDNALNVPGIYGSIGVTAETNKPGGRHAPAVWKDIAGNIYLLGGSGYPNTAALNNLNDLWKLNISTAEWTWIAGSNTGGQKGIYGVKGTSAAANGPGARYSAAQWIDDSGKLWLFGGSGFGSTVAAGYLNDLWSYTLPHITLPVLFNHFAAKKSEGKIQLSWSTSREENSHYFIIERSTSNGVFGNIGRVNASGSSSSLTEYNFNDLAPLQGINLYRLKQFDTDGRFIYSKVVSVLIDKNISATFTLLSNPVISNLELKVDLLTARQLRLSIKNTGGIAVLARERFLPKGTSLVSLPVDQLPKGVYYLTISSEGVDVTKTFIKP